MTPSTARAKLEGGKRILVLGIVASLSATALLAIGTLLFGDFGEREGRILTTTALLAGYGLLALPAGFLLDQRRLPRLAATLLVLASAGFGIAVASVWTSEPPAALPKSIGTVTAFAIASTQIAALAARRRDNDPLLVRRLYAASTATALVLAAMITAAAWAEIGNSGYYRILAALAVLDILLAALQPILAMARPAGAVFHLRVRVEPNDVIETTVEAPDIASAAAKAIRTIESGGREVTGLERVVPSGLPNRRLGTHADAVSQAGPLLASKIGVELPGSPPSVHSMPREIDPAEPDSEDPNPSEPLPVDAPSR
jgi:MFS family permease